MFNANYKKIMVDYYKNYAEKDNLNPGLGWKNTFEDLFGMTMEKFYQDFANQHFSLLALYYLN